MQKMGWAVAFLLTSSVAGALGLATYRRWTRTAPAERALVRRDPNTVTDVELNLILNKVREGDLLAIQGNVEGAKRAWAEAHRRGAGLWQIHEGLGDSYGRARLFDAAVEEYRTAESILPARLEEARPGLRFKRAAALEAGGRGEESFALLLDTRPPQAAWLFDLYGSLADQARMLEMLRSKAETEPRLWGLVATLLQRKGATEEAARSLGRYVRLVEPWNVRLARQAIDELRAAKRHAEALDVCRAWARALPQDYEVHQRMGDLWREMGDEKKAYLAYTAIVDVRPGDADAHRSLGRLLRDMKRFDEALREFEKSKALRPEEPDRWIDLAETLTLRDPAAGEKLLDEIAKKNWEARFGNIVDAIRRRQAERFLGEMETARKNGDVSRVREIRRRLAEYNVPEGAFGLKVIMTWDTATDIDMDVIDPAGEHVHHGQPNSKAGGRYWVDNTQGRGPETFTIPAPAAGTYRIGAHFHSGEGRTTVKCVVILREDTDQEERTEHTLVFDKAGEQKFIPDLIVK